MHLCVCGRRFEGEIQIDEAAMRRKWQMEEKKKNLTPDGFRYASAPKKSSGLGSNDGRIGQRRRASDGASRCRCVGRPRARGSARGPPLVCVGRRRALCVREARAR